MPTTINQRGREPQLLPRLVIFSRYFVLLTFVLLLPKQLLAQSQDDSVQEIVVTSNRIPVPLRQIGTSVTVLDEFDMESHGNISLSDILRQMPAIGSSNTGGPGKPTSVRIRGEEGFRTLTLLDGIRILDPSTTQISTSFENLLSDGLGRVEILRGPQGLAYGADAGGIINIDTRTVEEGFQLTADAQTGRYGSSQYAANIAGDSGNIDYFLSGTDYSTDGFNSRASDTTLSDNDGYDNSSLHARLGVDVTERFRIEAVHRQVDGENEFDGCFSGGRVDDCADSYQLSAGRIAVEYDSEVVSHSLSYHRTETDRESFARGVSSFTASGELERIEYLGSATDLPGFDLVFGADQEEASNNDVGRDNTGVFLEYLSDFSDELYFTAGLRHDDNDDFGTNTSYRVSSAWLSDLGNGTLKLKGALGTGFRAPSPFEISYNSGAFAFPPASGVTLAQEESKGWEAGVEYFTSLMRLEAVYFEQDVENAIFFDLSSFSGYLQDTGSSSSRGVELSADLPLGESWRITGNYTYNDTEHPDGSQRLLRPRNLFNIGALYNSLDGRFNFSLYYRSQADAIDSGNISLDDFGVLDVTASYQISANIRVYGRVENLLDEDYQEINDFNTPGSAAFFGMRYTFVR